MRHPVTPGQQIGKASGLLDLRLIGKHALPVKDPGGAEKGVPGAERIHSDRVFLNGLDRMVQPFCGKRNEAFLHLIVEPQGVQRIIEKLAGLAAAKGGRRPFFSNIPDLLYPLIRHRVGNPCDLLCQT